MSYSFINPLKTGGGWGFDDKFMKLFESDPRHTISNEETFFQDFLLIK